MALGIIDSQVLSNIALVLRGKTGKTDLIAPADMAVAIADLPVGSGKDAFYQSVIERTMTVVTAEDLSDLSTVGNRALAYCTTLKSVTFPSHFENVGVGVFYSDTALETVNLNEGLTELPQHGFRECRALKQLTIPSTVNLLNGNAVENTGITSITCLAVTPPVSRSSLFYNDSKKSTILTEIKVPAQSVNAYKTATNWAEYADIIIPIEE